MDLCERVAPFYRPDQPVLLIGPPGSGKTHSCQEIVDQWNDDGLATYNRDLNFVDCSAYGDRDKLLTRLCGHTATAYTGCGKGKDGLLGSLEESDVLVLDELGSLDPCTQALLMRIVLDRRYARMGEEKERHKVKCKILATTWETDNLRPDLLGRFAVVELEDFNRRDIADKRQTVLGIIEDRKKRAGSVASGVNFDRSAVNALTTMDCPSGAHSVRTVVDCVLGSVLLGRETVALARHVAKVVTDHRPLFRRISSTLDNDDS